MPVCLPLTGITGFRHHTWLLFKIYLLYMYVWGPACLFVHNGGEAGTCGFQKRASEPPWTSIWVPRTEPRFLQEQEVVFMAESALQPFSVQEASAAHTQLTISSQTQPLSLLCQRKCPQTVPVTISPSSWKSMLVQATPTALHSSGWPQMCDKFPASAWQLPRALGLSPQLRVSPTLSVLKIPTSHLTLCFLFSAIVTQWPFCC